MEVSRIKLLCLLACIFSLIPNGKGIINPNLENKLTILTKSEKSPENVFQEEFETTIKFNSHMSPESGKESTRSLDKSLEATNLDPNTKSSREHIIAAYAPEFKPVKKTSSTYMYLVRLFSHNQKNDNQNLQSSWVFSGGPGMPQIIAVECPGTSIPRNAQFVELNPPILDQALRQQHVTPLETHPSGISKNREEANVPDMYHHKNMGSDQSKDVYTVSQEMAKPTYEPRILESSSKTSDQSNETPM
ncbi:hypothetical protein DFH28DRAFT_630848 [Melampsora americana]|nr:hypothetical protein DFH28DRAFT_630848 [Melampsora americana]